MQHQYDPRLLFDVFASKNVLVYVKDRPTSCLILFNSWYHDIRQLYPGVKQNKDADKLISWA